VDELHGDVAGIRAGLRQGAQRQQPPAAGEALGHQMAEPGDPVGLVGEEAFARLGSDGNELVEVQSEPVAGQRGYGGAIPCASRPVARAWSRTWWWR